MRKITLLTAFLSFMMVMPLLAQDCNCDKLLENGLYSFTRMTKTESFSKDLRNYYLSESFKQDIKSGKWGGSLTLPINGIPFSIGMNDSDEKFATLRTKLLEVSELKIDEGSVQASFGSIPNTSLYEAYVECNRICAQNGSGFIPGKNLETEDVVVFTIYYRPSSPTDPMPVVKSFNIIPEGSLVSGNLTVNQQLTGFTTLVTCKRPADKDIILTLQTDRGAITSKAYAQESISSNKDLPLGTILQSYLNFEQFNAATKNSEKSPGGIWTSAKSKWAPCDGRPVPNSKFQTLTSQLQVPDLRGMFVRGLNSFDPYQPVPAISAEKADPETRVVGGYQADELRSHRHNFNYLKPNQNASRGGGGNHEVSDTDNNNSGITDLNGGPETRPKNIAVFYYIKIN